MSVENRLHQNYSGTQVLGPSHDGASPLIICFHGSGTSCSSWQELAQILSQSSLRVLLYDRGELNPRPGPAITDMIEYLNRNQLGPPYVLVAHSYGGTFAREFLQRFTDKVAGMVLVETGQETVLDVKVEEAQYRNQILGNKPLSVIRGNTALAKFKHLEARVQEEGREPKHFPEFEMLEAWDKEDERLKKRQLKLSRNSRYIHIPDVGHEVISARPEAVAEEIKWVLASQATGEETRKSNTKLKDLVGFIKQRIK